MRFLKKLRPFLLKHFSQLGPDPEGHVEAFLTAQQDLRRELFVHIPRISYQGWTRRQEEQFARFMTGSKKDYLPFSFEGLTPSGDALTTTLGNTLRSIAYIWYYCRRCNIDPTDRSILTFYAAGDDVVIFGAPDTLALLREAILTCTS